MKTTFYVPYMFYCGMFLKIKQCQSTKNRGGWKRFTHPKNETQHHHIIIIIIKYKFAHKNLKNFHNKNDRVNLLTDWLEWMYYKRWEWIKFMIEFRATDWLNDWLKKNFCVFFWKQKIWRFCILYLPFNLGQRALISLELFGEPLVKSLDYKFCGWKLFISFFFCCKEFVVDVILKGFLGINWFLL